MIKNNFELTTSYACHGGEQRFYQHLSNEIGSVMKFSVFLPHQALIGKKVPALLYLAGLTCTEETFPIKAGAQYLASKLGLALISPDTSPREANIPNEANSWDFGVGAGFYLDATQAPWSKNWRMESWIINELLEQIVQITPVAGSLISIFGHSMGGHGALTLALRNHGRFQSVSAFAPITNPINCPWGEKAFAGYLGPDRTTWNEHDATMLMQKQITIPYPEGILIDQGLSDKFLSEKQLLPESFKNACMLIGQPLNLRFHTNYDHSYYFIQSFVNEHIRFHAQQLGVA